MTKDQFIAFSNFRREFKEKIQEWSVYNDELRTLQIQAAKEGKTPEYPVDNPVVYNKSLDFVTQCDDIKLIIIGDNPGKNEQLNENQKYLVGLAGKLGQKFFAENPELNTDFRKNVIILNKTPIHSARTEQLRYIMKNARPEISNLIIESQKWMARNTALLNMKLGTKLWLVGYAELKGKGLFLNYRDELISTFGKDNLDMIFVYQHFSMNRFTIDLKNFQEKEGAGLNLYDALSSLGTLHRKEIFKV
ncbi:MAG: hypothetical protein HUK25_06970 [Treponema sp.]|nr:hypothetical protein [Treponema sp.]